MRLFVLALFAVAVVLALAVNAISAVSPERYYPELTLLTCEDRGGSLEDHLYDGAIVTQCDGAEGM